MTILAFLILLLLAGAVVVSSHGPEVEPAVLGDDWDADELLAMFGTEEKPPGNSILDFIEDLYKAPRFPPPTPVPVLTTSDLLVLAHAQGGEDPAMFATVYAALHHRLRRLLGCARGRARRTASHRQRHAAASASGDQDDGGDGDDPPPASSAAVRVPLRFVRNLRGCPVSLPSLPLKGVLTPARNTKAREASSPPGPIGLLCCAARTALEAPLMSLTKVPTLTVYHPSSDGEVRHAG